MIFQKPEIDEEGRPKRDYLDWPWWQVTFDRAVVWLGGAVLIYALCWLLTRDQWPLAFGDLFRTDKSIGEAVQRVWWFLLWGVIVMLYTAYVLVNDRRKRSPRGIFVKSVWIAINQGFFEELIFRVFGLFIGMSLALGLTPVLDVLIRLIRSLIIWATSLVGWSWLTDGPVDAWLPRFMEDWVLKWLSFFSGNALAPQLTNGWLLGTGIVLATILFVIAHWQYNWWFARLNLVIGSLVMWWLVFNYGVVAAMVVHALYDVITNALMRTIVVFLQPD